VKLSLGTKLTISYTIALWVTALAVSMAAGYAIIREVRTHATDTAQLAASSTAMAVEEAIEAFHDSFLISTTAAAVRYAETLDPGTGLQVMLSFVRSQSDRTARIMYLLDSEGSILHPVGTKLPDERLVRDGLVHVEISDPDTGQKHAVHAFSAFTVNLGLRVVTVEDDSTLIPRIPMSIVTGVLASSTAGAVESAALFAGDGSLIGSTGDWKLGPVPDQSVASGTQQLDLRFGVAARYLAYDRIPALNATVAIAFDADYLEVFLGRMLAILAATAVLSFIIIVLVSRQTARIVTGPVRRAAQRLTGEGSSGDRSDELGKLVRKLLKFSVNLEYERRHRERNEDNLAVSMSVFRNSNEGIIVLTPTGTIDRVNPAFSAITGYEASTIRGSDPRNYLSDEQVLFFDSVVWKSLRDTGEWSGEIEMKASDGSLIPILLSLRVVLGRDESPRHYIGIARDISDIKQTKDRLEHLATHDPLTNLANRTVLSDALERDIEACRRRGGRSAVVFVDIDHFKDVNDTHGHHSGDELLRMVAGRLKSTIRAEDMIARFGGDEFVIVLSNFDDESSLDEIIRRMLNKVREPATFEGITIRPSATAGIAIFPDSGRNSEDLLKNADAAMYQAKRIGRGGYHYHDAQVNNAVRVRLAVQDRIRFSLRTGEFVMLWQPVVRVSDSTIAGAEALIRLRRGDSLDSPSAFMPQIEGSQISMELARWVLADTIETIKRFESDLPPGFRVAVNVAATEILQREFVPVVIETLSRYGVAAERLAVEVTESAAIRDVPIAQSVIRGLRRQGIRVYLDDFGTGYSSLQYLRELGVDAVKLDRLFLVDVPDSGASCSLVRGVVQMAHGLGLLTTVEGVEREDQLEYLKTIECDFVQGYHTGFPMDVESFVQSQLPS